MPAAYLGQLEAGVFFTEALFLLGRGKCGKVKWREEALHCKFVPLLRSALLYSYQATSELETFYIASVVPPGVCYNGTSFKMYLYNLWKISLSLGKRLLL